MNTETAAPTWKNEAGPIQSKKVREVLEAIRQQHRTHKEQWGVLGVDEHEMSFFSPYGGGSRDDVTAAWSQLGERFGWKVTRENYAAIVEAAQAELVILKANIPVREDRRKTPEQHAIDEAASAAREVERENAKVKAEMSDVAHGEVWAGCASEFRQEIKDIAAKAGLTADEVFKLWRTYANQCEFSDQSALVSEFLEQNKDKLTPKLTEPRINVRNRLHLRQLVEAGRVELVGSYHYDEQMGTSGHKGEPMPCAIKPDKWEDRKEGVCYIMESDFSGNCGRWSQGKGNRGTLYVHSNCNYDLHILPAPTGSTEAVDQAISQTGVVVRKNEEHQGVEIVFPGKPSADVIARVKAAGFRWSFHSKVWYKKYGCSYAWAQAHKIAGIPLPGERDPGERTIPVQQSQGVDRFDADIEDRNAEACGLLAEH